MRSRRKNRRHRIVLAMALVVYAFTACFVLHNQVAFAQPGRGAAVRNEVAISTQPENKTATVGDKITLTVVAAGTSLTYQWQCKAPSATSWSNSTQTGAKTASLTIKTTASHNGYQYRCVVKDGSGNQTISNPATLTILPKITVQPGDKTVEVGATATLTVAATGKATLTYQWQCKAPTATTWSNSTQTGAKTTELSVKTNIHHNGYWYRCVVTDGNSNQATSKEVRLTVLPKVTVQPTDKTATVGDKVTLTVAATGKATLKYQWQCMSPTATKWSNSTQSGAKTDALTISTGVSHHGYKYRCVITDGNGNQATSDAAVLTILPKITTQPEDKTVYVGTTATLTVVATGKATLSYQWQAKSRTATTWSNSTQSGAKTATLSISVKAAHNGYQYRCIVTDGNTQQVISDVARLEVIAGTAINETNFPDKYFREFVLDQFDFNHDGALSNEEIAHVTEMYLSRRPISNLKGIEYFTALTDLDCSECQLTELPAGVPASLTTLNCSGNMIMTLDLSGLTNLIALVCDNNYYLTTLDLSSLTDLEKLDCSGIGNLTFSVSGLTKLKVLACDSCNLESLDLSDNTNLEWLQCADNKLETLDLSANTKLTALFCNNNKIVDLYVCSGFDFSSENVNIGEVVRVYYPEGVALTERFFPDGTFLGYISERFDRDRNGYLSLTEIRGVHDIRINGRGLYSLKGIEYFTELDYLECAGRDESPYPPYPNLGGYITSLDLRYNTKLNRLDCRYNQIETLNVSGLTRLSTICCSNNNLSTLNLDGVPVSELTCDYNMFTALDLSGCTNLWSLSCNYNQITQLNVSGCTGLSKVSCDNNQLTKLDLSGSHSLSQVSCNNNQLTELKLGTYVTGLRNLYCTNNELSTLPISGCTNLTALYANGNALTQVALSSCTKLKELDVSSNSISELDVSALTELQYLYCAGCSLTELNPSNCLKLVELICCNNQITDLWIPKTATLEAVDCTFNNIIAIDIRGVTGLKTDGLKTDDGVLIIDGTTATGVPLSKVFFPDDNLRNCFQLQERDSNHDGFLSLEEIRNVLGFQPRGEIYDFCGVEFLTEVESLVICYNGSSSQERIDIDTIDLTGNAKLRSLSIIGYNVGTLDVHGLTNLHDLGFTNASVANLNAAGCTSLYMVGLPYGGLKTIDITNCTGLTQLNVEYNQLSALDVSGCSSLQIIRCGNNNLTSINLKECAALTDLYCKNNRLTEIDVSYCTALVDSHIQADSGVVITRGIFINETTFPDNIFRAYVSENIDINQSGTLSDSEIRAVTTLTLDQMGIAKFIGLEHFRFLQELSVNGNSMYQLDVRQNGALTKLSCTDCANLKELKVNGHNGLQEIDCSNTKLTALDTAGCSSLTRLICSGCPNLTSLNVNGNTALKVLTCENSGLTTLDLSNMSALEEVYCDGCSLTTLNLTRAYMLKKLHCADNAFSELDVTGHSLLSEIDCSGNSLETLSLSNLPALTVLHCYGNELTDLNLIPSIVELHCQDNYLTVLDVRGCINLDFEKLVIDDGVILLTDEVPAEALTITAKNFPDYEFRSYILKYFDTDNDGVLSDSEIAVVTVIDVSECAAIGDFTGIEYFTELQTLNCCYSSMTKLDLSSLSELSSLICGCCENLTTLVLSDSETGKSCVGLTEVDVFECPALTSLDVSGCSALETLNCYGCEELQTLTLGENDALLVLDCSDTALEAIDLTESPNLTAFSCGNTQITSLDARGCADLEKLYCVGSPIETLSVSGLTKLWYLDCSDCNLIDFKSLDVSGDSSLKELYCNGNALEDLNLTGTYSLTILHCNFNHLAEVDLSDCYDISRDDLMVDHYTIVIYPKGAKITPDNFPDTVFREYVTSFDLDEDGRLSEAELAEVTEISITETEVKSFVGLEYFKELETLDCHGSSTLDTHEMYCGGGNICVLDLTENTKLKYLDCSYNHLMALDVSGCTSLQYLDCSYNRIQTLTLPNDPVLETLNCSFNRLPHKLDVSGCSELQYLACVNNILTELDVSGCSELTKLNASLNRMLSLNIDGCTALEELNVQGSPLTDLDVSELTALKILNCGGCRITELDASNCLLLEELICYSNNMEIFRMPKTATLTVLDCMNNAFTALDIRGILNLDPEMTFIDNDVLLVDGTPEVGVPLTKQFFPDDAFRTCEELTHADLNRDGFLRGEELTYPLNLHANVEIKDFRGIEFLTGLKDLSIQGIQYANTGTPRDYTHITSLDLSNNINLQQFHCTNYSIDNLDMHGLFALVDLQFTGNCFLTNVDLSGSGVPHLTLSHCGVESINLSGFTSTNGGEIILSYNRLTTLDISGCSGIYRLNCQNNQLTSLTLTGCTGLSELICTNNHLTEIDIRTCTRLNRNYVNADSGVTIIY